MKLITVHCADRNDFNLQYEISMIISSKMYNSCHNNNEFQSFMKYKYNELQQTDVFLWADWDGKRR